MLYYKFSWPILSSTLLKTHRTAFPKVILWGHDPKENGMVLPGIKFLKGGEGRTEPRELNVLPQTHWTYTVFLPKDKGQWTWDWLEHWVIIGTHKPLHCKGVSPCEHQVVCGWFSCTDVGFLTLGASRVRAETGPYTQRTSRDLRKRQTLQMSRWQVS